MKKKFLALFESAMGRFTRGGYLTGYYVKFVDSYKSHPAYKALPNSVKAEIGNLIASGLNLQITNVKNKYPTDAPGDIANTNGEVVVDIAADTGGGRYSHSVTVPTCCLEVQDYYPNLAPIPDAVVRPNNEIIKPEEVKIDTENDEMVAQTRKAMQAKKLGNSELELPNKNVKIPANTAKPVSYTAKYL